MGFTQFLIEDEKPVLGYTFPAMAEFLAAMYHQLRFDVGWTINGFPLAGSSDAEEVGFLLFRGICCYENVPTDKALRIRSKTHRVNRWELDLAYRKATGEQFDMEHEFRLTDRHDKFIRNEVCKLSLRSIILRHPGNDGDPAVAESVAESVASDVRALHDRLADIRRSTSNLTDWGASPYGMVIYCAKCRHRKTIESTKIASVFKDVVSVREASEKLRCSQCHEKGEVELSPVIAARNDVL